MNELTITKESYTDSAPLPLSYALSLLLNLTPMPVHVFKHDYHYLEKFDGGERDSWNVLKTDFPFRKNIIDRIKEQQVVLITDDRPVIYAGVVCADDLVLVVGPIVIASVDQNFKLLYAKKHQAENVSLFFAKPTTVASFILLIHSSLTKQTINLLRFLDDYFLDESMLEDLAQKESDIIAKQLLYERPHNPASFEQAIVEAIINGDRDALLRALQSPYANMRGTLSYSSPLRSEQNLAIVDITIATRAAINAGLNVEQMYTLSDAFILEVEDCKKVGDASALYRACALRCCQYVRRYLDSKQNCKAISAVCEKAIEYMHRHVFEKFSLDTLASKLKISKGYLSRTFKDQVGMTLSEYSRLVKINRAKTLLSSSDKSISEISDLLSFNSQSHFGRTFLEIVHMTPAKYRAQSKILKT